MPRKKTTKTKLRNLRRQSRKANKKRTNSNIRVSNKTKQGRNKYENMTTRKEILIQKNEIGAAPNSSQIQVVMKVLSTPKCQLDKPNGGWKFFFYILCFFLLYLLFITLPLFPFFYILFRILFNTFVLSFNSFLSPLLPTNGFKQNSAITIHN